MGYHQDGLTPVERAVHAAQLREGMCHRCRNQSTAWGEPYCELGQRWPKRGMCRQFEPREG